MKPLVSDAVERFALTHTTPRPSLLEALRKHTLAHVPSPQMQVGAVEGTFLKLLVSLSGAQRVLELGTYTGYSALCMAEGLAEGGSLLTCEIDPAVAHVAQTFFDQSPVGHHITIQVGPAMATLTTLSTRGETFDFAFLDADKESYLAYYDRIVPLLRQGGLLVADNTLWSGKVADAAVNDAETVAIREFGARASSDPRVETVLLTVRDGMTLVRKR